jgi:hypothetical protein
MLQNDNAQTLFGRARSFYPKTEIRINQYVEAEFFIANALVLCSLSRTCMAVKLSTIAICLGLWVVLVNLAALLAPAKFTNAARKFPRNVPIGLVLMIIGTLWFLYNVSIESLADFESMKKFLFILFIAIGIGTCMFVRDFLAVRGLAIILLLLGKLIVDNARWVDSNWRLIMVTWAYIMVVLGMWLTVSPWRLRDILNWHTATPQRLRMTSAARLAFGLLVTILGFVVF